MAQVKPLKLDNGVLKQMDTSADDLTVNSITANGSNLTSLNAANISSGELNDSRLSTNVALLTATQSLTNKTFGTGTAIDLGSDAEGDIFYRNSAGDLARLGIGAENETLSVSASGIPEWVAASTGSVSSVSAGNGLDFATITSSGSVTLGTPGTITSTSTDAVTATSHTHAVDATIIDTTSTQTMSAKTLTSPVLNTGVSGTAVLDDDSFATASATTIATSESIKAYVDATATGALVYKGVFDASAGVYTAIADGNKGDFYKISVGGTISGRVWNVGDMLLFNVDVTGTPVNSELDQIDNTEQVTSVFTRTGAITAQANDYTWAQIDKTTSDIADITSRSHTDLTDIGSNTHAQIDSHISTSAAHGTSTSIVGVGDTQTLTNKTLTSPTIGDFSNAGHNHSNAANGGTIAISATTGTLSEARGGTNQTTFAAGDLLYASAADTLSKLAKGSDGEVLKLSSGLPVWGAEAGGSQLTESFTAGVGGIAQYDVVYVSANDTILKADASAIGTSRVVGLASAAITASASGVVVVSGTIAGAGTGWTAGNPVFLSETAGGLTQTAPTTSASVVMRVGYAKNGTDLAINIGEPIILA